MSKILRRPMFRGGGTISSYGNGITAPLVNGYAHGGNINTPGGIVDLPGGYAETPMERFLKQFGNASVGTSGGVMPERTFKIGQDILDENINFETENQSAEALAGKINEVGTEENSFEKMRENNQYGSQNPSEIETESIEETYKDTGTSGLQKIINEAIIENTFVDKGGIKRNRTTGEEINEVVDESNNNIPPSIRDQGAIKIDTNNPGNILPPETAEPTEISARDAIAENQELFKELLGSKPARGQDISDMLLRFSGSEGNTVGEKFRNYTKAEAAAGPGRNEKISQTAAGLAINDYVAGKRSEEQIEKLMKVEDYRMQLKESAVNINEGDNFRSALNKVSRAYKLDPNSNKSIAITLRELYNKPSFSINKDPKKLSKTKPPYKELQIGFNIVTDKNGVKSILEKISSNDTQPRVRDDIVI